MAAGDKIREARERLGLSQADLARRVGISQPAIKKIEAGATQRSKFLPLIAKTLKLELADLEPALRTEADAMLAPPLQTDRDEVVEDLPVFAAAEGGAGEMVVSTDPIQYVARPWYMGRIRDGYAVLVVGDSMAPAFEPGDIAVVNPRLPPMRGKDCIFIAQNQEGAEFTASIKRLLSWTDKEWRVQQFNPPKGGKPELLLPRSQWPKALRVVGKYYGG